MYCGVIMLRKGLIRDMRRYLQKFMYDDLVPPYYLDPCKWAYFNVDYTFLKLMCTWSNLQILYYRKPFTLPRRHGTTMVVCGIAVAHAIHGKKVAIVFSCKRTAQLGREKVFGFNIEHIYTMKHDRIEFEHSSGACFFLPKLSPKSNFDMIFYDHSELKLDGAAPGRPSQKRPGSPGDQ